MPRYRSFRRDPATFCAVLAVFLFAACLFAGIFRRYGAETRVGIGKTYYFLERACEEATASAVAGTVYASGGAGYVLGDSVVISCYFREQDARSVQTTLSEKGVEATVSERAAEELYLRADGDTARRVAANAETVDTFAHILYDTANGLERAEIGQEEARAAVGGVVRAMRGLREGNGGEIYGAWNLRLLKEEEQGRELAEGILFARDLRLLQVELCLSVVEIGDYFG